MQNFLGSVCGQQEQARKPAIGFAAKKGGMIPKKEEPAKNRKGVEKMRLPSLCEGQKGCEAQFLVL
jgi:hypothetical protein